MSKILRFSTLSFFLLLFLTGCTSSRNSERTCTVIFEDHPSLYFPQQIYNVTPQDDLSISIGLPHGERISSANYEDYTLSSKTGESENYDYYTLTLHKIRYSALVRLTTAPVYTTAYYGADDLEEAITVSEESPHLFFHTLPYEQQFERDGYVPIGWNTAPDGSGTAIGFGSRFDRRNLQHLDLYAEWVPCTPADLFDYRQEGNEIIITGYHGSGDLVIPAFIDGCLVTAIAEHAFESITADCLVLPWSIKTVAAGAFHQITVKDFYFFDCIEHIPEEAFENYQISHLHILASKDPVYSGSYFDTLADKIDYLASLDGKRKIVLLCGSSARFGFESPLLENAYPDYHVVNLGVFAYSNMLPQAMLALSYMEEGDILLSSPEFDAISQQFCGHTDLDKETFCMMESNYDMFARLDCRQFTSVFSAFENYNQSRTRMSARSYQESPSYYDEDGQKLPSPSYNRWGDYIVYRENNLSEKNFGIKRAFYHPDYFTEMDIQGINAVYDSFAQKGITVYFTYSPRSKNSISDDSTPASMKMLEDLLNSKLHATIISSIDDSLWEPLYFYGTDNHLSTEGANLHTQKVIEDLRPYLEKLP